MHTSGSSRAAFTLIELLVVVAVIGILASLLMPATLRALNESRKTECKSNLNQLGQGLHIYANTFDSDLPPYGYYRDVGGRLYWPPFWTETMGPFLYPTLPLNEAMDKAVRCPMWTGSSTGRCRGYASNYGVVIRYYAEGYGGRGPLHDGASMSIAEIKRPSNTFFAMDGTAAHNYTPLIWTRNIDKDGDGILDTYREDVVIYNGGDPFRHDGALHGVFTDGHVRAVRAREWLTDDTLFDPNQ